MLANRLGAFGQISDINDHLCVSGSQPLRPDRIRAKKITCIVNATVDEPPMYLPGIDYLKIRIEDTPFAHIDAYFDIVADRIRNTRDNGGKTLVHCLAGVSRSATLCIAYLMKHENECLRDAFYRVKACRSVVRPNNGFWKQLVEYEKRLFGRNSVKMLPSKWGDMVPDLYVEELRGLAQPASDGLLRADSGYSSLRWAAAGRPGSRSSSAGVSALARLSTRRPLNSTPSFFKPPSSLRSASLFSSLYNSDLLYPMPKL